MKMMIKEEEGKREEGTCPEKKILYFFVTFLFCSKIEKEYHTTKPCEEKIWEYRCFIHWMWI